MKTSALPGLATMLLTICLCDAVVAADVAGAGPNAIAAPAGWLQLPARELVLDVQHESLEYGARLDASEFTAGVLNLLLGANYKVRLSDEFVEREIKYYRENLDHEVPVEMSKAILSCLESARVSGVLDWDCFKGGFTHGVGPTAAERHLPWMSPPVKAKLISLAGSECTNLACLRLSLKWTGRSYGGAVQHTRRPGGLAGETVLLEGKGKLWAFGAEMRLTKGDQTLFEKEYPREEWQSTYATIYEQPLWKTSQAILQEIASGLRPKPAPSGEPGAKKPRKHAQPDSAHSSPP